MPEDAVGLLARMKLEGRFLSFTRSQTRAFCLEKHKNMIIFIKKQVLKVLEPKFVRIFATSNALMPKQAMNPGPKNAGFRTKQAMNSV